MNADRLPPQNLEAEMAALGSILVDREMFEIVASVLKPTDFYAQSNESIFAALVKLNDARRPLDKISLAEELKRRDMLDRVGGLPYLTAIMDTVPTAASAEYYARIVREKSSLRELIHAGTQITKIGFDSEDDVERAFSQADHLVRTVVDRGINVTGGERAASLAMRIYESDMSGDSKRHQVSTPWASVNRIVGGFNPGDLIGIVAGPAAGKSGAVNQLADWVASRFGQVALFGLEMGKEGTVRRLLAYHSGVPVKRQREGNLSDDDAGRVFAAMSRLENRKLTMYGPDTVRGIVDMRAEIRALHRIEPVRLVIVDVVNRLEEAQPTGKTTEHTALTMTYRALGRIAVDFKTSVIAVQHLNREGMKPGTRGRQILRYLRGGGNFEGEAQIIIAIDRPDADGDRDQQTHGEFQVIKNRDYEEGSVPMRYLGWRHLWLDAEIDTPRGLCNDIAQIEDIQIAREAKWDAQMKRQAAAELRGAA